MVTLAVAAIGDLHIDRVAKGSVETARVLGRVGKDGHVDVAGGVECGADRADLTIHHPAGCDHAAARIGLGNGGLGVDLERAVVVDLAVRVEYAAVTMIGVLVDAQVGHEHDPIPELIAQCTQGNLHDALRIERARTNGVFVCRHAEQNDRTHTERCQLANLVDQAGDGVLHHPRQRRDRHWCADALAHEQRCDEIVHRQAGLGNEFAQRGCATQAAGSGGGKVGNHGDHRTGSRPHSTPQIGEGDLGVRTDDAICRREIMPERQWAGTGNRVQTGGLRRRDASGAVLECDRTCRLGAERGTRFEIRRRMGLGSRRDIDGDERAEVVLQLELVQTSLHPVERRVRCHGYWNARRCRLLDEGVDARPAAQRLQQPRLHVAASRICGISIQGSTEVHGEFFDPNGSECGTDDILEVGDRILGPVLGPHRADGLVLHGLGVDDGSIEIEHDRVGKVERGHDH